MTSESPPGMKKMTAGRVGTATTVAPSRRLRLPLPLATSSPSAAAAAIVVLVAAACLVAPSSVSAQASDQIRPFGYQSDSTHSVEFRAKRRGEKADPYGYPLLDPSSYVGQVQYDPLHHALYVVGQTYGSGSGVFDGVDVYDQSVEMAEIQDVSGGTGDDPLWWEDMATGLRPHMGDPGVPDHGPWNGDCYYAVLALPMSGPGEAADGGGVDNSPGGEDSGGIADVHRVKLLHSRRFGTELASEGCSALDVLMPTMLDDASAMMDAFEGGMGPHHGIGGYFHEFDQAPPPTTPPPSPAVVDPLEEVQQPTAPDDVTDLGLPAPTSPPFTNPLGQSTNPPFGGGRRDIRRSLQDVPDDSVPPQEYVRTRSVRLLMAGHVETPVTGVGYVAEDLALGDGDFSSTSSAYAFAQQVDIRLPAGDLEYSAVAEDVEQFDAGEYENLDYVLHTYGKEEDELAQELEKDFKVDVPREDFLKIVTSGVESRALLSDGLMSTMGTVYPVSLVADATTKSHYYVAMLASEGGDANENHPQGADGSEGVLNRDYTIGDGAAQRAWTDYPETGIDDGTGDHFGFFGRPNFGGPPYRVILRKMSIEVADLSVLTPSEINLSGESMDGNFIAMRHTWMEEFAPDSGEDVRPTGLLFAPGGATDGAGDVLIMVGTTSGRGSAFGTTDDGGLFSESDAGSSAQSGEDLDGFIAKIRADTGAFAGGLELDINTNTFVNRESKRIASNPGRVDIVTGVCAKPLRAMGILQEKMDYVYVVGSTSAVVEGVADVRNDEFLSKYPVKEGSENETMEAFLMKIDLSTMNTVWTVQVGAIVPGDDKQKGSALGYGCAVTRDGEDVYLTGLVKENGVVTDFSYLDALEGVEDRRSGGGTDVFVSSYKTSDGTRTFLKQVGSTRDDYPSRGNGGITTDRLGNAIITGNTRGSLMRSRSKAEFIYGPFGEDAAMEIFIMSLDRLTSDHIPIAADTTKEPEQPPEETVLETETEPTSDTDSASGNADPVSEPASSTQDSKKTNGALVGIIAVASVFIVLSVVATAVVIRRIKKSKRNEAEVIGNSTNLHEVRRQSGDNVPPRSAWRRHHANNPMKDFDPDIKVEVRNSASGGWHGAYDNEHVSSIDFGVPGDDIAEKSLFMEDDVQQIEDSLENYVIGETNNDVSDEELIKAYNEAMAVEIEPESPEVEFAMSGVGSQTSSGESSETKSVV
ncbi:hypothetical protein ACHAW5_009437 [Stephanodiscus triporus]|uniref:Uncharacterized protein n=1 Tax=Stephanodiscus triporus TaxID=2934178 RepID=A0ABD3R0X7_9STRA